MLTEEDLRALLPDDVALACETSLDGGGLMGGEEAAIAGASPGRRRDFALGRGCARRALLRLGVGPCPIPVGDLREPLWPQGVTGSITHCSSLCAAAVGRTDDYLAIGIDAEIHRPLSPRVREMVASSAELDAVPVDVDCACWETVVFSAKESVFKAWSPIRRSWLDFSDARVSLDGRRWRFTAEIDHLDPGPFRTVEGLFAIQAGVIFTAALVKR